MEPNLPACPRCAGTHINLFGHQSGKQRFRCCACNKTWRENPQSLETDPQRKEQILAAYHERMSQRGLARVFRVSRKTVSKWLKKSQSPAASEPDPGASPA